MEDRNFKLGFLVACGVIAVCDLFCKFFRLAEKIDKTTRRINSLSYMDREMNKIRVTNLPNLKRVNHHPMGK